MQESKNIGRIWKKAKYRLYNPLVGLISQVMIKIGFVQKQKEQYYSNDNNLLRQHFIIYFFNLSLLFGKNCARGE
jgi:hypothetical protein